MPCTGCRNTTGLYLLASEARLVFVQFGDCGARYWLDTGCGTVRPEHLNQPLPGSD